MDQFDLLSAHWDTDLRVKRAITIAGEIRPHIVNAQNKTAMEYGCGTGLIGFQLIGLFQSFLFADASPGMISKVNEKLESLKISNATAVCMDLTKAAMPEQRFDYIITSMAMHHIKDTSLVLRRFFSLLNPGGHLLMVDLDLDDGSFHANEPDFDGHHGFEHNELAGKAKEAGFLEVMIHTFYHNMREVMGKKTHYSLFLMDGVK